MSSKVVKTVLALCVALLLGACDVFKQIESSDACEQVTETIFDVIEDCVKDEGYSLDPTVLNKSAFVDDACDPCDNDKVFVVDVDKCDDAVEKIDCDDILDLNSLRNYGLIILQDEDNWEPSSCEDLPVDC